MGASGDEDVRSGRAALLEVLEVRRRAQIGFGAGAVVATAVFVVFVVLPAADRSTGLYLSLGLVLALSLGLLFTGVLVAVELVRLARDPDRLDRR